MKPNFIFLMFINEYMGVSLTDLTYISERLGEDRFLLEDLNIFLAGGTGFIGKWFLESIIHLNDKLKLNIRVSVLSRNSQLFISEYPQIALNPAIKFLDGDIRDFKFPDEKFPIIIQKLTSQKNITLIEK